MKIRINRTSFFLLGSLIFPAGNILMLPFLWEKLTPADYGILAVADLLMAFGSAFIGLQLESSLNRLYYDWPEGDRKKNISTLVSLNVATALIFGALIFGITKFFSDKFLPENVYSSKGIIELFLGYLIISKLRGINYSFLRVTSRALTFFLFNTGLLIIQIILIFYFVFYKDYHLYGYVLSLLIAEVFFVICLLGFTYFINGFHYINKIARDSLRFSIPLIPGSLFSSASLIVERSVLLAFVSLSDIGIYTICQKIASVIQTANGSLKMIFAPKVFEMVANHESKSLISLIRNKYVVLVLMIAAMTMPTMLVMTIISGNEEYLRACLYFPFFVIMGVIIALLPYYCSGAFFSKNTSLLKYISISDFIIFGMLSTLLGAYFGLNGIIFSKLVACFLMLFIAYKISQYLYRLPFIQQGMVNAALFLFIFSFSLILIVTLYVI